MTFKGPYIVEGDLLLTRYEWSGGIRPTDKELAERRREIGQLDVVAPIGHDVAVAAADDARQLEVIALRASSPLRPKRPQEGLAGLGLFEGPLL